MKISNLQVKIIDYNEDSPLFPEYNCRPYEITKRSQLLRNKIGDDNGFDGRNMFWVNSTPSKKIKTVKITDGVIKGNPKCVTDDGKTADLLYLDLNDINFDVAIGGLHKEVPILVLQDEKKGLVGVISCPRRNIDKFLDKLIIKVSELGAEKTTIYISSGATRRKDAIGRAVRMKMAGNENLVLIISGEEYYGSNNNRIFSGVCVTREEPKSKKIGSRNK